MPSGQPARLQPPPAEVSMLHGNSNLETEPQLLDVVQHSDDLLGKRLLVGEVMIDSQDSTVVKLNRVRITDMPPQAGGGRRRHSTLANDKFILHIPVHSVFRDAAAQAPWLSSIAVNS